MASPNLLGELTALPRPPSWVEGGRFAAGEGGGEALAVEPSHFSTGSVATVDF